MVKDDRLRLGRLGEYYSDLLTIDAAIAGKSANNQASSLLCAKLNEKDARIRERVQYLAEKRGINFKDMWNMILKGEYDAGKEE